MGLGLIIHMVEGSIPSEPNQFPYFVVRIPYSVGVNKKGCKWAGENILTQS